MWYLKLVEENSNFKDYIILVKIYMIIEELTRTYKIFLSNFNKETIMNTLLINLRNQIEILLARTFFFLQVINWFNYLFGPYI